ncbi:nitrogen fixation protein FixH [Polaromonas aquatica]|uniref:nitrogen fixation protein FixH n=1 Tax=Polaromonas aquatica TaxID=332657 RepID=UPI003D65C507
MNASSISTQAAPWWTHGHVWLVISGPAIVVVASVATVFLAIRYPDAVLGGQEPTRILRAGVSPQPGDRALAPALEGRNHAATPDKVRRP